MRRTRVVVLAAVLFLAPSVAHAEPPTLFAPRDPLERFAGNLVLFALSGATALAGVSRRPPLSLVVVAWPATAPQEDETTRERVASWTMPAGGRRPMFDATFVDLRF